MNPAAKTRERKEAHPEDYCADARCLWRVHHIDGRVTPCPKHPTPTAAPRPVVPLAPVVPVAAVAVTAPPRALTTRQAKRAVARVLAAFGIEAPELHVRRADWLGSDLRPTVFVRTPLAPEVAAAARSVAGVRVIVTERRAA